MCEIIFCPRDGHHMMHMLQLAVMDAQPLKQSARYLILYIIYYTLYLFKHIYIYIYCTFGETFKQSLIILKVFVLILIKTFYIFIQKKGNPRQSH